jgi:hypothetical protein
MLYDLLMFISIYIYIFSKHIENNNYLNNAFDFIHPTTYTVNVENITVFLISLFSRFDNFPQILNLREYSVIRYTFYLLFFLNWIRALHIGIKRLAD